MAAFCLVDGSEEISYTDSLFILVNDILERMAHGGR